MPIFEYTARNLKGDLVKDSVDLPSKDDVVAHLRMIGEAPVDEGTGPAASGGAKVAARR